MIPLDEVKEGDENLNMETIRRAFKIKKNSFREFFISGTLYGYQHDFNKAFNLFKQALKKNPDNYLVYFNMAGLKYKLLELLNSIDSQDDFLVVEDRKKESKRTLEQNKKDYQEILQLYDRVLVLNPQFSLAYFNRAYIKSLMNDLSGAVMDYQQAVSLDPDLAAAFFNRGLIFIYMNDMDHGCEDISKAGELGLKESYFVIKKYCR
jgi:tetratricopeptide (TPR) repeat protein